MSLEKMNIPERELAVPVLCAPPGPVLECRE
jgi:hypothetical protein